MHSHSVHPCMYIKKAHDYFTKHGTDDILCEFNIPPPKKQLTLAPEARVPSTPKVIST